ncbi:iron-regulated protein [Hahella sp. KA22]|uniref:imelysin family protein n=1 Tax=Hahella sp. KA22 TaxID=1628392 RepID=UPI000FDD1965|nr:imelysin family protein [Hahella sp. KA22]AZZ89804.1 iron-regulated protein [Hahella sp. KA22]QAY53174.1 iron-regulated protein [Hahella sp. KA22]
MMRPCKLAAALAVPLFMSACAGQQTSSTSQVVEPKQVVDHFANMAHAMYEDSLLAATQLNKSIDAFLANPTQANLDAAKAAYAQARVPYQQSEVLRFDVENGHVTEGLGADGGLASIDAWEGQVNAWPLDEALIDYVSGSYEGEYNSPKNIINSTGVFTVGGQSVDISTITPELIAGMNEIGGAEANVTSGVHAIEFLLWGQDLNGTGPGAGARPVSDYYTKSSQGACTSGDKKSDHKICQRRAQYLKAAADLLVSDLQAMEAEWTPAAGAQKGTLRNDFLTRGDGLQRILDSMGDLAIGELASERMKVAILFGSTEDEHDCFSDLTHIAIYNNAMGVVDAYRGSYTRLDGSVVRGPSLADLVAHQNPVLKQQMDEHMSLIESRMRAIVDKAEAKSGGKKFDQLVGGSAEDKKLVLDAAAALVSLEEPLSEGVSKVLALSLQEFDAGTCPTEDVGDCES